MADATDDGAPRRRTPELPPEFAPLAPLGLSSGPPRRDSGEAPRLRLTAAASRRNAPDRSATASAGSPPGPPPAAFTAGPVPATVPVQAPVDELLSVTPGPRRSRRLVAAVGLIGLLVVLVVLAGAALLSRSGEQTVAAEVAPSAEAVEEPTGAYDPPVALVPDSEYVETEVLDGDDLQVTHWISTAVPMDRLRLRPPSSPVLADLALEVEDLVVAADGVDLGPVPEGVRVDAPMSLPSAGLLYVRYRLADALQGNSSVDDRALATVTALGIGLEGRSLPRTHVFPGGRVMTLACLAQGARAVPASCGTYVEGAWQVRSAAGEVPVTVIAQFDLAVTR